MVAIRGGEIARDPVTNQYFLRQNSRSQNFRTLPLAGESDRLVRLEQTDIERLECIGWEDTRFASGNMVQDKLIDLARYCVKTGQSVTVMRLPPASVAKQLQAAVFGAGGNLLLVTDSGAAVSMIEAAVKTINSKLADAENARQSTNDSTADRELEQLTVQTPTFSSLRM